MQGHDLIEVFQEINGNSFMVRNCLLCSFLLEKGKREWLLLVLFIFLNDRLTRNLLELRVAILSSLSHWGGRNHVSQVLLLLCRESYGIVYHDLKVVRWVIFGSWLDPYLYFGLFLYIWLLLSAQQVGGKVSKWSSPTLPIIHLLNQISINKVDICWSWPINSSFCSVEHKNNKWEVGHTTENS